MSTPNIEEKLQNIKKKYSVSKNAYENKTKTPTNLSYSFNQTARAPTHSSTLFENTEKKTHIKSGAQKYQVQRFKDMQKAREDYSNREKKLSTDHNKESTKCHRNQARSYIGHIRNVSSDLIAKNRGYSDNFTIQNNARRNYLNSKAPTKDNFDVNRLPDRNKSRQFTLDFLNKRQDLQLKQDNLERITREYSKVLQKAYQFAQSIENKSSSYMHKPTQYSVSPAKFDKTDTYPKYERLFGKDYNALHQRFSFGIDTSKKQCFVPQNNDAKFELNFQTYKNLSPMNRVKQFNDISRNQNGNFHKIEEKRRQNRRTNYKDEDFNYQNQINSQRSWINSFNNVQDKIKGYIHKEQMRF